MSVLTTMDTTSLLKRQLATALHDMKDSFTDYKGLMGILQGDEPLVIDKEIADTIFAAWDGQVGWECLYTYNPERHEHFWDLLCKASAGERATMDFETAECIIGAFDGQTGLEILEHYNPEVYDRFHDLLMRATCRQD